MNRKYKRYEKGLETIERRMLESQKMKSYLKRLSTYFGVKFEVPEFRPVYINKKFKATWGMFFASRIELSDGRPLNWVKDVLWHETCHGIVHDNVERVAKAHPEWPHNSCYHRIQKAVFTLVGDSTHNTYKWKLKCGCGWWTKSIRKYDSKMCNRCSKILVSSKMYAEMKKRPVDISKYRIWNYNRFIGIKI